ncbi:MAG: ribulose-phosphate 3-epimerase [Verrucomicrobia bacterium]|nr:ribulose-phosphate 3-epimerase [Verrucomicrobiota bacterium]MCF7707847.1 ribulose-phosphate 3-epimerase [Verrucomicrobiota bacterium]
MIIAPSLLASDYRKLAGECLRVKRAGGDWLHWDIMDGNFVPNLTFGPAIVKALRPVVDIPFDVHLMCLNPDIFIEKFAEAGADTLTVHVELLDKVPSLIWKIRAMNCRVGLSINPPTNISLVKPFLEDIDQLLVMTVNPGFGGQAFIEEMVPKIRQAAVWRKEMGLDFGIEVDGGIDFETVSECAWAGADIFVSGTTLFRHRSMKVAIRKMRRLAEDAGAKCEYRLAGANQ